MAARLKGTFGNSKISWSSCTDRKFQNTGKIYEIIDPDALADDSCRSSTRHFAPTTDNIILRRNVRRVIIVRLRRYYETPAGRDARTSRMSRATQIIPRPFVVRSNSPEILSSVDAYADIYLYVYLYK